MPIFGRRRAVGRSIATDPLVESHGDGVGQVQAAVGRHHRNLSRAMTGFQMFEREPALLVAKDESDEPRLVIE